MLGGFSFQSLFYSFDIDIIAYLATFLILFALITWILRKTKLFEDSKGIMTVISISSSLLALYGLIRANFSISDLMFRFNIPDLLQQNLIWMLFLVVFLIFWIKFGLGICLMLIGAGLMIIGILKLVYASTGFIVVGAILFILGYLLWRRKKKKSRLGPLGGSKIINKNNYQFNRKYDNRKYDNKTFNYPDKKIEKITKKDEEPTTPKERKQMGEASLDVIIGGKSIRGGRATLDLTSSDGTIIYVKNGGTGGTLGWRASCNNELSLSKTGGKLALGKYHEIKVNVRKRDGREYASVIINGRGGGRLGGRATRGRVMITFKVGLKKKLN